MPAAGNRAIEVRQIPEPASHQTAEAHYSIVKRRVTAGPTLPITSTPNTPTVIVLPAEADGRKVEREAQRVGAASHRAGA